MTNMKAHRQRLLTFQSGGWVLLLSAVIAVAIVYHHVLPILSKPHGRIIGDGRTLESYQFDLSVCLVPREKLLPSGASKDRIRALVNPKVMTLAEIDARSSERGGKYLVSHDRVIGVTLGGEARAYPLRILNWHEVVNDVLGGVPVAVTYHPVCDSVVVFDRRAGAETLEFGVSGLFYNSTQVLFDRRPQGRGESLWSQMEARAIAGPFAARGARLNVIPAAVVHWADWRTMYPDTTALRPDPLYVRQYRRDPYVSYYGSDALRYPVDPLPPRTGLPYKTPVLVVGSGGQRIVFPMPTLLSRANSEGIWETQWQGIPLRFVCRADPAAAFVTATDGTALDLAYAFWFAWHATHPDDPLYMEQK